MEPVFTFANLSDTDLVIELMREFYSLEHLNFQEAAARQALQQILSDRRFGLVHLITVEGEVAGYLVLAFSFSLEFHGQNAFVDELYLRESYQGQGIGKKALNFAEKLCQKAGIKAMRLEVERQNERAQAVYRKTGYQDHDRYLMTKWIDVD